MAIKKKTLLVENTPAKTAAKAAVKKAAIKSAARDVSKGVEATPIEVSDPKDPRLKRYNDSLYLHNKYKNKQQIDSLVYKSSLPDKWQKERNKIDSITSKYNSENRTKIKQLRDSIFSDTTLSDESKKSLYNKKSLALREKFNSSPEYADMIARRRYINKNESFKRVSGVLEKYNFNSPDKKFKERGIKPVKWNKNTETYTGGEQENTYKEGRYGSSLVYRNTSPTKGETITTTSYSPEFKKPTQPIRLKKSTERVENGVLKTDTVQSKPRVKRPGERIVPDNRSGNGYPNVDNVYINGKLDSIQNQAGERLKYGTKFTREWQYRKKK